MKRVFDYISILVFATTFIWFGYSYYQKYSLEKVCSNIKIDKQKSIDKWQSMIENCIAIEEMRHDVEIDFDHTLDPDSVGVDWYDEQLLKQENINAKIGKLYTTTSDFLTHRVLIQDKLTSDIVFGIFDYEYHYSCNTKFLNINGKEVFYKKPIKVNLPINKKSKISAISYNYNEELRKIDTTIIASRTLQLD